MKIFKGKVISLKMQKTAVVEVERKFAHPLYKKIMTRSKKYKVDTGEQVLNVGDLVEIIETRPISKDKYFKVKEIKK